MRYVVFNGDGGDKLPPDLHLDHPFMDATLCGLTMDGDSNTAGSFSERKRGNVSCAQCIAIIKACRGIRIKG